MLKRFSISLVVLAPVVFIGIRAGRCLADDRISQAAISGIIWFWIAILFVAVHRKYPRLFRFDDSNPLPKIDIGLAVILFMGTAYGTAAAVLFIDGNLAEPAILGIIAIATFIGWLFRDKDLSARPDASLTKTQASLPDMPRIRLDLASAFVGMAALNATFFSVTVRDPGLFLLAMIGNILVMLGICWLARDKDGSGANAASHPNGA